MIAANGHALSTRVVRPIYTVAYAAAAVFLSMVLTGLVYVTVRLPVIPAGRVWIDANCPGTAASQSARESTLNAVCSLATWRDR